MVRPRVFGLLAITLYLLACMCASAKVSEEDAMKAVEDTQVTTKAVLDKAVNKHGEAAAALNAVETYKREVNSAVTEAEKIAKEYPKAKTLAAEARGASDEFLKLYKTAFEKAKTAVSTMSTILSQAKWMNKQARNSYFVRGEGGDFTKMKQKADALKLMAKEEDKKIDNEALTAISEAQNAQNGIPDVVTKALLAKYHADGIAAIAKIETVLKEAVDNIAIMEKNKDEISATVQEINKLYTEAPDKLKLYISNLYSTTEIDLKSVTKAIEKAKEAQQEMATQQKAATDALEKVKATAHAGEAEKEARDAARAAREVEKKAKEIKEKVEAVTIYAHNALERKKSAEKSIKKGEVVVVTTQANTANPSTKGNTANPSTKGDNSEPVNDATEIPARIANVIHVSVQLLLAMIACAASY